MQNGESEPFNMISTTIKYSPVSVQINFPECSSEYWSPNPYLVTIVLNFIRLFGRTVPPQAANPT
jgi:hypothetical protein